MTLFLASLLSGCSNGPLAEPPCADPAQYWPDANADGVGEPTLSYVGCDPPQGWVAQVAPAPSEDTWIWDTGPFYTDDSADSGDSGGSGYTGYTGTTGLTGQTGDTGP